MRLQEVLKERETEISLLEESLKESEERAASTTDVDNPESLEVNVVNLDNTLSPKTMNRFDHIRKTMEGVNGHSNLAETNSAYSEDESLERLNELMLCVQLF